MSPTLLRQHHQHLATTSSVVSGLLQQHQINTSPPQLVTSASGIATRPQPQHNGQSHLASATAGKELLVLTVQQRTQSQGSPKLSNGPSSVQQLPSMVTETELRLQEERVRLLRQQLMAAESSA